jgi:hypothetical protein
MKVLWLNPYVCPKKKTFVSSGNLAIENGPKFQDGESFHSYVKVYQAGYPH